MIQIFRNWTLHYRLLTLLVLLNIYDFVSTKMIVDVIGPNAEANPAMRWIIDHYTIWGILAFKLAMIGIFAAGVHVAAPTSKFLKPTTLTPIMLFFCMAYGTICCWNSFVVYQVWVP